MASLPNMEPPTESSLTADGLAFYKNHLSAVLEASHDGEFVAIEPYAARYFLGHTATAVLVTAHREMPDSQFFLTRIGRKAAHKIGGHGSRIR